MKKGKKMSTTSQKIWEPTLKKQSSTRSITACLEDARKWQLLVILLLFLSSMHYYLTHILSLISPLNANSMIEFNTAKISSWGFFGIQVKIKSWHMLSLFIGIKFID